MKIFAVFLSLLIFNLGLVAQTPDVILATANNQNFNANDLAPEIRLAFENIPASLVELRKQLFDQQIVDALLETEAAARKTTPEKLVEDEIKTKIQNPSAKEIQAVFDANRDKIGIRTLEEVRPQIIEFLRRDPEDKLFTDYISSLKTKYKFAPGRDAGAPNLKPFEVLATVNGRQITAESFDVKIRLIINDFEAQVYDQTRDALERIVYSNLLLAEAKAQNIEAGDLIAREITDKLRQSSPFESEKLESVLRKKLFQKYNAKFFLKEIAPVAQNISIDNNPSEGSINAPVTVVMFSDFQCPTCSVMHPILKQVLTEYAGKTRFVVRDFPLTQIHENAFRAALAAAAANAQGKFFEYIELLYNNQHSLDTASLKEFATKIGLDRKRFDADLDSEKFAGEVRKDMADGKKYGITGTPTIFVNGVKVRQLSAEAFQDAIGKALKK